MRFVKTAESIFDIPSGFKRVEYLESTGTQYIDTGVNAKTGLTIESKFKFLKGGGIYCGAITTTSGSGDRYYAINLANSPNVCFTYMDTQFTGATALSIGNTYTVKTVLGSTRQEIFVDGVSKGYITKTVTADLNWTLGLFAVHRGGTFNPQWYDPVTTSMYYCKIWDGDTLVRDFIPCIDPLGRPCLYDLVGKKPYYNQGTGEFTVGRQIIPVEYLESSGTQYIDTGYTFTAGCSADYIVNILSNPSGNFCGCGTDSGGLHFVYDRTLSKPGLRTGGGTASNAIPYTIGTKVDIHTYYNSQNVRCLDALGQTYIGGSYTIPNISAYLFCTHALSGVTNPGQMQIYSSKLYDANGVLVRNYTPCKDENNVGFMFDTLSGTVYLNAGTGAFAFGENKYKTKLRLVKDNKLPAGYTQVEYLESSGTQRITTDVSVTIGDNFNLIVKGAFTTLTGYSQFMGVNGGAYFGLTTTGYYSVGQATGTATGVLADTNNHIFDLNCTIGNNQTNILKIDGASYSNVRNNSAGDIRLFDVLNSYACYFKMTGATIYKNNILVRDFVPALDPTGTPCIYDMVTKTPFYNQGTGTFITGKPVLPMVRFIKDIVPREYAIVNYIESTGEQYIDTGVIGTEGVLSEIDVMKTTATTNECFLGTWNSGSARCWLAYAFSNKWYPGYGGISSEMVPVIQNSWTHIKTYITQVSTRKYFGYNVNGIDYTLTGYFTPFTGQNTILIFAMNTNTGASYKAKGRIGVCKITKDSVLVRNFIPVVRRIDGTAGMWDTVTKQFFGNSGTGNFNYGV